MEDISNRTLALLLAVAIVVSLVGIFTAQQGVIRVTGFQSVDSGEVSFEQQAVTAINVTTDVDFGAGSVNFEANSATLDSFAGTSTGGNWSFEAQGLRVENIGTVNVSLDIESNVTAFDFVGGTQSLGQNFTYRVANEQADSCGGSGGAFANGSGGFVGFGEGNNDTANDPARICNELDKHPDRHAVNVTFQIVVPKDADPGVRQALITFTGTSTE